MTNDTLTLWRAAIDTRSFSFEAYGASASEAKYALAAAWQLHCRQTGADPTLLDTDLHELTPYQVRAGQVFRDDSLLLDINTDKF